MPPTFQLNTKQLFLTYPQCPVDKNDMLKALQDLLADLNILEYVVARELHANGDFHIHAYLKLGTAFRTTDPKRLDVLGYHGNYQGCRSIKNVVKYCTKADDFISNIDVGTLLASKSNRRVIAEELVLKKRPLEEVVVEHPQLLFGYQKLKLDLMLLKADLASRKEDLPTWIPNPWGKVLPSRLKSKRRHYWIYSDKPNLGKTFHFAKPLAEQYRAVICTGDLTYWNVEKDTQLLILDDFNAASLKFHQFNQLCDGTFAFRIFQRGTIVLDNYLVIVLSNFPISTLYPFRNDLLYARFKEIELK